LVHAGKYRTDDKLKNGRYKNKTKANNIWKAHMSFPISD